jgi:hypothetical protein
MKRMCVICLAAFAVACNGASESHNSSQSGATARAGLANPDDQPVTLSGCLRNANDAEASAARPTGSAGEGSAGKAVDQMAAGRGALGERFTLTNAKSASAASDPAAASYILDGNLQALRQHVDQQVRLTGKLDPAAANTAGPQRVRVESVESLGGSCAER